MSYFDCEPSSMFRDILRAARKAHACEECGAPIVPGEKYHAVSGLSDGEWWHIKVCDCCERKRCALATEMDLDCIPYGGGCLAECYAEYELKNDAELSE